MKSFGTLLISQGVCVLVEIHFTLIPYIYTDHYAICFGNQLDKSQFSIFSILLYRYPFLSWCTKWLMVHFDGCCVYVCVLWMMFLMFRTRRRCVWSFVECVRVCGVRWWANNGEYSVRCVYSRPENALYAPVSSTSGERKAATHSAVYYRGILQRANKHNVRAEWVIDERQVDVLYIYSDDTADCAMFSNCNKLFLLRRQLTLSNCFICQLNFII